MPQTRSSTSSTNSHTNPDPLPPLPLPDGLRSSYVTCPIIGLTFHYIEAGYPSSYPSSSASSSTALKKPLILLLHGYPELAFSWRKVMLPLADVGYYVVAPDQPGYGRTTGWDTRPYAECDLSTFTMTHLARDLIVFVAALGYEQVFCMVGHDFGAVTASICAFSRPDIFRALVTMSHPLKALPSLPFGTAHKDSSGEHGKAAATDTDITAELAALDPPRKHYQWYHSTPRAAQDMLDAPQGVRAFLRGYFYVKSADYAGNMPRPLKAWSAPELAQMPEYYIMPLGKTMPETIQDMLTAAASHAETAGDLAKTSRWLPDADIDVYVREWTRTGFQGGLNWYRAQTDTRQATDLLLFAGRPLSVPFAFVSGAKDWGNYQKPGVIEKMAETCDDFRGITFIEGAGHWPQQERPAEVVKAILAFIDDL